MPADDAITGMLCLPRALVAWGGPDFAATLCAELEAAGPGALPLQQGLAGTSVAADSPPQVMIISSTERAGVVRVKAGIFYAGIVAGCSCADDPTPVEEQPEYCVVQIDIDRATGDATVTLLDE